MATMKLELSVRIPIIFLNSKIKKIETKKYTCQLLVLYQEGEGAVWREIILWAFSIWSYMTYDSYTDDLVLPYILKRQTQRPYLK